MSSIVRRARSLTTVLLTTLLAAAATPAHADRHDDGFRVESTSTYQLLTTTRTVRVTVEAQVTNTIAPRRRGDVIETTYFTGFTVPVLGTVTNLTATGPNGRLRASVDRFGTYSLIDVEFASDLLHDRPRTIELGYDLVASRHRTADPTRVNDAYGAWYVTTPGDDGLATVRLVLPSGFELASATTPATLQDGQSDDGRTVLVAGGEDALELFFAVSVIDEDRLLRDEVEVAGTTITVRGWPDDRAWQDYTTDIVTRAMPVLVELLGTPLPTSSIDVLETSGGSHLGYAGSYALDGTIELSDQLDAETLVHELSHGWLNGTALQSRWIVEGLAQEVTRRVGPLIDRSPPPVPVLDEGADVAMPLAEWDHAHLLDEGGPAAEAWGYDASHAVVHELFQQLSDEQFADVVSAVLTDEIAYPGAAAAEEMPVRDDWRVLLDHLTRAGVGEDAETLLRDHVLSPAELEELDDRAVARDAYATFVDASEPWGAPLRLRRAMARWDFGDVDELITASTAARNAVATLAASMEDIGGELPADVLDSYVAALNLTTVEEHVARVQAVADDIGEARTRAADATVVERIGLLGSDATLAAAATQQLSAGDVEVAAATVADELDRLAGARGVALQRIAVTLAVLLLVAGAAAALRRRRARHSATPAFGAGSHESHGSHDEG